MADTALKFGPDWLRALANAPTSSTSPPSASSLAAMASATAAPKYSLAKYRYGREEMLALMPKNPKLPDCLMKDTSKVVRDNFTIPMALTPVTEDEQRLWSRCVNSDAVLRASGKSVPGNMGRGGRGGSIDRGRGRGRGGYYQRGLSNYDHDSEDIPSFSRPKPIERSQSASEKDQRWDDRDRRFDRSYSGRGNSFEDSSKMEPTRNTHSQEYWRRYDKDDEPDWRSSGNRSEKLGPRGSWRNPADKDRREVDRNHSSHGQNGSRGPQLHQKNPGPHLPEWSTEEANEQDVVGTFDSSGAFLETKVIHDNSEDIYVSDEADEGVSKDSQGDKRNSSSQRTPQKPRSPPRGTSSSKQTPVKPVTSPSKPENFPAEKHPPKLSEPSPSTPLISPAVGKPASNVIKSCNNSPEQYSVNSQKPDGISVTSPNVPDSVARGVQDNFVALGQPQTGSESPGPSGGGEEDTFAHHKKATENMVAQWTEEEEQKVISRTVPPTNDSDASWFYKDPQGQIQGPFKSGEMLEWFTSGYFTMSLMVRRNCDEKFSQLGDLIKTYGRVPFLPNSSPPPSKAPPLTASLPTPPTQTIVPNPVTAPVGNQFPKPDEQLLALQQQLLQHQLMQQQLLLRQAQLQQLFAQLKQQENFASLNTQQQQQVLMQQFMSQLPRPNIAGLPDQPNLLDAMTPLPLPMLGLPMAPLLKNDMSLWNMPPTASPWPMNIPVSQPSAAPASSIWDIEPPKPAPDETELEKHKRLAEEQEKHRKAEEDRLAQEKEMEDRRRLEQKKRDEERLLQELKMQEEEKQRLEELRRIEEEKQRLEELRQREEKRRQEEELRRMEEQKRLDELRRQEELKHLEELKRQEEKRLEELRKQEERKRLEELKRKEEEKRQEEERKRNEKELEEKRKKEELQKKLEMERERERIELEKQKMLAKMKELEAQREIQKQKEKEEEMRRLAEIKLRSQQGPAWGIQNSQADSQLSLADIQKLQEEKERQEREERERIRLQQMQQQATKQAQQNKNGLSWAKSFYTSAEAHSAVKSLAEIQLEEAERLAEQQKMQKPVAPPPVVNANVGVWGNSSQLTRITAALPGWNSNSLASAGFWDDALSSTQAKKQTAKSNESSAFPALSNHSDKPVSNQVQSNKSKNVRAKKEEDAVKKLFSNHKPTDEFTAWCTEALSAMPSSVDVPTFVAFLKDIESPYEVHDYVKSYLGDGKEPREFAKQFLERRSVFKAKQNATEDNSLWGPAPAINPVVKKPNPPPGSDDGNSNSKGKSKRRKNRMQKLDSSMLGFTVQPNPDRLNVGEIEHLDM